MRLITCKTCGEKHKAKRTDAKYCSNKCRATASNKKNLQKNKAISKVANAVIDCNREDVARLYNNKDLFILKGKLYNIFESYYDENGRNSLLHSLHYKKETERIFIEFEKKFKCKFEIIKSKHPDIFERVTPSNCNNELNKYLPYCNQNYSK